MRGVCYCGHPIAYHFKLRGPCNQCDCQCYEPQARAEPFSFVALSANPQTPEQTLLVATYELGRLIEYQHKARVYPEEPYYCEANQKKEMADHISMCRMYCEQRGWSYSELEELGEEAYLERMEDIRKYGKKE